MFKMYLHGNHLLIFGQSKLKDFQACFQNLVTNQRPYSCCVVFVIAHNKTTSIFSVLFLYFELWFLLFSCYVMSDYVTPWPVACQAPLSFTVSWSLLKFLSIELVMLSNHLILCCPLSFWLQSFPASGSFPKSWLFASNGQTIGGSASATVLPMNIQS